MPDSMLRQLLQFTCQLHTYRCQLMTLKTIRSFVLVRVSQKDTIKTKVSKSVWDQWLSHSLGRTGKPLVPWHFLTFCILGHPSVGMKERNVSFTNNGK